MKTQEFAGPSRLQRALSVLPPVVLILSSIFLFGPFTIYQGNIGEFQIPLIDIATYFLVPALALLSLMSAVGVVLPGNGHKRYVSILFVLGLLIWLQGNIFVWDYGILGKGDIDWTKSVWRGWIDLTVWSGFMVLAIFMYKHVYKIARSASVALVSLQTILLVFNSIQQPDIWSNGSDNSLPPSQLFEFSSNQNVIHVILDEFQSDVFQKIIAEDTGYYYNVFKGFTLFKQTAGAFPSTMTSMPSIVSGSIYKNDVPIEDFIDTVYNGKTIANVLYANGYDVDLSAPINWYGKGRYTNWYHIPVPYGASLVQYERTNAAFIMSLVALRHAPHFLKRTLFDKVSSLPALAQEGTESYEVQSHFANEEFLQDLIDNASVKRFRPLYKFIHLTTTHWPAVLDTNCRYAGTILPWEWVNIRVQAKCSLVHFIEFLNRLKSLNIYDSSLIILHADHGYYKVYGSHDQIAVRNIGNLNGSESYDEEDFAQRVCSSAPLLAVKPPNSKGPLRISNAPTALTDVAATITSILKVDGNFGGKSVYDVDSSEIRERKFYYYADLYHPGEKYFGPIDEFSIKGNLYDRSSWTFVARHLPPGGSYAARIIKIGGDEANDYLRFGWSLKEQEPAQGGLTYRWALGQSASLFMSFPKTRIRLTANVKSLFPVGQQSVTLMVDGKKIGGWKNATFSEWEKHSITIEPDANRPSTSTLDFNFSKYVEPAGEQKRRLALLFESISIEEQGN